MHELFFHQSFTNLSEKIEVKYRKCHQTYSHTRNEPNKFSRWIAIFSWDGTNRQDIFYTQYSNLETKWEKKESLILLGSQHICVW